MKKYIITGLMIALSGCATYDFDRVKLPQNSIVQYKILENTNANFIKVILDRSDATCVLFKSKPDASTVLIKTINDVQDVSVMQYSAKTTDGEYAICARNINEMGNIKHGYIQSNEGKVVFEQLPKINDSFNGYVQ